MFISFRIIFSLIASSELRETLSPNISDYLKRLPESEYIIGPGDQLLIIVSRFYPELNSDVVVDGETIYLPKLKEST